MYMTKELLRRHFTFRRSNSFFCLRTHCLMKIFLPLAWIYGAVMAVRNWLFDHGYKPQKSFDLPIISVGNLAVGGTGKTPHTEYLLRLLADNGRQCTMLSRGYGRKTSGYHEAKGGKPTDVGDEPWQVHCKFPEVEVCVCEKRVEGIERILSKHQPDVILLDDAYQHRYVKPGLSIMLTEYSRPYFSDYVMPAGRLRENRSGARRANVIIVTKCPNELSATQIQNFKKGIAPLPHQKVFFTRFDYGVVYPFGQSTSTTETKTDVNIEGQKILLLCGIARPKNLIEHLRAKCQSLDVANYRDHHNFSDKEIEELGERAKLYDKVITTEKDAARLASYTLPDSLRERLLVQPIEVHFINNELQKFNQIIIDYVTENSRNRSVD